MALIRSESRPGDRRPSLNAGALLAILVWVSWGLSRSAAGDPPDSPERVMRGRVIGCPDGRPLPRARVVVYRRMGPPPGESGWPLPNSSDPPLASVQTDEKGRFVLTLPRVADPTPLLLQAEANGRGQACLLVARRADSGPPAEIEFALPPGVSCTVRVRTRDGAPVAGAGLVLTPRVRRLDDTAWEGRQAFRPWGETGLEGQLVLAGVLPGEYLVRAATGGNGAGWTEADIAGGESVEVVLEGPRTLRSTVTSAKSGQPIPGACVHVTAPQTGCVGTATTGEDGSFRIDDLPAGDLRVHCTRPGYDWSVDHWADGTAPPELLPLSPLEFTADEPTGTGRISGVVRHAHSGLPVPDIELQAAQGTAITDADGHFHLEGIPPGVAQVTMVDPGTGQWLDSQAVYLGAEGSQDGVVLECRLWPSRIQGSVVDAAGRRVPGARVFANFGPSTTVSLRDNWDSHSLETDLDGSFQAAVATEFPHVVLIATHPTLGRARSPACSVTDLSRQPPIELRLEGTCVAGTLRDASGGPIAGARVCWEEAEEHDYSMQWAPGIAGDPPEALTDRLGRFLLPGLPPGPAALRVFRDERDEGIQSWLWLQSGSASPPIDLCLRPARSLRGRVRNAFGLGEAAVIFAESTSGARWKEAAVTAADGTFEFAGVPATTWGLTVRLVLTYRSLVVRDVAVDVPLEIPVGTWDW